MEIYLLNPHSLEVARGQCFESALAAPAATTAHISLSWPWRAVVPCHGMGMSTGVDQYQGVVKSTCLLPRAMQITVEVK